MSFVTVWHMQQELSVNTTTARSDASFITRSAICYALVSLVSWLQELDV